MNDKILTLLGFAAKAGKLSYGFDSVCTALSQKKSKLVLTANDVSVKSQKEILYFCDKYKITSIVLQNHNMETISHAVGKKCGVLAVNDESFAQGLMSTINSREELK